MPTKYGARVKLNRKALDGVSLAIADGFFAVAKAVVEEAKPPDATPYGAGLVRGGGAAVFVGSKKVAGYSQDGSQPRKPRAVRTQANGGIVAFGGYGFPARFQQLGTARQPARPFLFPFRIVSRAPGIIKKAAAYRIARLGRA